MRKLLFSLALSLACLTYLVGQQQARKAYDLVESVGVCTHFDYTNTLYVQEFDNVKSLLGELGVRYVRDRAAANNDRGQERSRELYDEHGIKSITLFNPRRTRFLQPDRIDELIERVARMPEIYAALEGPNEYDNNHPAEDTEWVATLYSFQERFYRAVKSHPNPAVSALPVLGPSTTFARRAVGEMGDFSAVCDYYNIHAYAGARVPTHALGEYLEKVPLYNGTIDIYATEVGYHNALAQGPTGHYPINEESEAKYLPRLFMHYFQQGIVKTVSYEFLNKLPDPGNARREENFGLVRNDLTPKPVFYAVKNMLALLEDGPGLSNPGSLNYTLSGQIEGLQSQLFQKADGKFYLALWRDVSVWNRNEQTEIDNPDAAISLTFHQPVTTARAFLPYNESNPAAPLNPQSVTRSPRTMNINLPDHLMIVEIEPAETTELSGDYQLFAKHSGKALAVDLNPVTNGGFGDPTTAGTNVFQYGNDTRSNRIWRIEPAEEGYYKIVSTYSGKALSVDLNTATNGGVDPKLSGANIFQYGTNDRDNRLWTIQPVGEGFYKIVNKYSNLALDVFRRSTEDGANIMQWPYTGNDNQLWHLVPISIASARTVKTNTQREVTEASPFLIYPNPAAGQLTIQGNEGYQIQLYDPTGRIVLQRDRAAETTRLDVSGLPPGIYLVQLQTDGQPAQCRRVVIK